MLALSSARVSADQACDSRNHERTGPQGGEQSLNGEKTRQWYDWVRRRVQDNQPYDRLVAGDQL